MAKDLFTAEWFPYYFERFEGSDRVAAMSLAEEGAYHRAIRLAWKYGSVPADSALLAAKIGKRCTPNLAAKVLTMFEPVAEKPSRMVHPTVEEIRQEQERKYLNRVKGGKAAAKGRCKQTTSSISPAELQQQSSSYKRLENTENENQEKEKREARPPSAKDFAPPVSKAALFSHPAIEALRMITGHSPPKETWGYLTNKIGVDVDIGKLTIVYAEWLAKGNKATNWDGITDWYLDKRKFNGTNQQQNAGSKPTNISRIADTRRVIDEFPTEAELGRKP